jgi:hypothetical protein
LGDSVTYIGLTERICTGDLGGLMVLQITPDGLTNNMGLILSDGTIHVIHSIKEFLALINDLRGQ